ncbi:MAG: hypothetical protein WCH99_12985 [Verrucomicrobiota bacterium]
MKKQARQVVEAQKLPDEEWNFNDQLKEEKDANLIRGVFFYEYFRYSKKLRDIVLHCRKFYFDESGKQLRAQVPGWEGINYNILNPEEKELIRQKTNGWGIVGDLVQGFMNNRDFPQETALQILKRESHNAFKKNHVKRWFCNLDSTQGLRFCAGIFDLKRQDQMCLIQQGLSAPGIEYRFNGNVQAQEFESVIPVVIDWRNPDKRIINDFRAAVLSCRRPKEFQKFKTISSHQIAIENISDKIPFKLRSALDWLGVCRRREAAKTWRDFFEAYYPNAIHKPKNSVGNSSGLKDLARPREADYRKAKLILDWFENGTPLNNKDFK